MATKEQKDVVVGDGYAVADLDSIGEGYGFRKIRRALGVTAFGVNAIVLPPGVETGRHYQQPLQHGVGELGGLLQGFWKTRSRFGPRRFSQVWRAPRRWRPRDQ